MCRIFAEVREHSLGGGAGFSLVVAGRFSCSMACGILAPQPGLSLHPPALGDGFLTTGPPGSPSMSSPLDYVTAHSYLQSNVIFSLRVSSSTFRKWHPHLHGPLLSCPHLTQYTFHLLILLPVSPIPHQLPHEWEFSAIWITTVIPVTRST